MRLLSAVLTLGNRFEQQEGFPVHMIPFPHVMIGRPNAIKSFNRIPIGNRYAQFLTKSSDCPRNGDPTLGVCKFCNMNVTPDKIRKVKEMVGHIETVNPVADHDKVKWINPVTKGSLILSKEKKTLMLVEERRTERHDRVGVLFSIEGHDTCVGLRNEDEELKDIHFRGIGQKHVRGRCVGVDRLFIMKKYDRVHVSRQDGNMAEDLVIELHSNMSLKLISAVKREIKASEPEPEPVAPAAKTETAEVVEAESVEEVAEANAATPEPESVESPVEEAPVPEPVKADPAQAIWQTVVEPAAEAAESEGGVNPT